MQSNSQIVIVDDDESIREAATNLFRSMGVPAVAFASAEEYLASDIVECTSCLVLDIHMPGMSGLALQQRLADDGRHIPIVFVTAFTDEGARTAAMESGAICFLTKPFKEGDLLDGLRSALSADPSGRT
jgi:FixJ family two-component response regulator